MNNAQLADMYDGLLNMIHKQEKTECCFTDGIFMHPDTLYSIVKASRTLDEYLLSSHLLLSPNGLKMEGNRLRCDHSLAPGDVRYHKWPIVDYDADGLPIRNVVEVVESITVPAA